MTTALVELRDVRKSYFSNRIETPVLHGINLAMQRGEFVAIMGQSGSGKSTLMNVLGCLDTPTSGSYSLAGEDVGSLSRAALAGLRNRTIGFVFQFHHLLPEFSAVENAAMPGLIAGIERSVAEQRATELLKRVGLGHRLQHRPGELSGGEQQRVALARALVMEPRLLLADEPTGNLDARTGAAIHELVVELNRERGMTMIVVTHNEDLAARMPRRVHMADGRILTDDESQLRSSAAQEGAV